MIRLIAIIVIAAIGWFAYTNWGSVTKNVDMEKSENAIKQEKTIQKVINTRNNDAAATEEVTKRF